MPTGIYQRKPHSEETKRKIGLANSIIRKGTKLSEETKRKIGEAHRGEKHYDWKGGQQKLQCLYCNIDFYVRPSRKYIAKCCSPNCANKYKDKGLSSIHERLRRGKKFKIWRESVFERDDYTCQNCDERGSHLHPHHIVNFNTNAKLRFVNSNGVTLCEKCHILFHTLYGKRNNNLDQLIDFMKTYKNITFTLLSVPHINLKGESI